MEKIRILCLIVGAVLLAIAIACSVASAYTVTVTSAQNTVLTTTSHSFTATSSVNANCTLRLDSTNYAFETQGSTSQKTSCSSADDATVGTLSWFISRTGCQSYSSLQSPSTSITPTGSTLQDKYVKIVKADGTYGSQNKALSGNWQPNATTVTYTYGSATDLWGLSWTDTDINDADFGVGISAIWSNGAITHYLKSTGFGFAIPSGSKINGILVSIDKTWVDDFPLVMKAYGWVSSTKITVYYQLQGTSHSQTRTLSQGNHTGIYVGCDDASNNYVASSTYWLFVDSIAPTPSITSIGGDGSAPFVTNDNTPTVLATTNEAADCYASSTNDYTYDQMVSNSQIDCTGDGTTSHTCQFSSAINPDAAYTFYVSCKDTAGNKNTASNNAQASATIDTTNPVPTITSIGGDNSAPYETSEASPQVLATTDESADCRASVDGDESYDQMSDDVDCSGDGTTSHTCAFGSLGDGTITFYVACRDTAGNKNTAGDNAQASATIDSTPVVPTITSIGGDGSAPYSTTNTTPEVLVTTDEIADCYASTIADRGYNDMVSNGDVDCTGDGTTSHTCDLPTQSEGSHTVYVSCQDWLGNKNTAGNNAQVGFSVDTTAPTPSFTSIGGDASAPYATLDNTPDVVVSLNEAGDCYASVTNDYSYDDMVSNSQINCVGDGTTTATCTLPTQADGSHTVYVACQDPLGNKNTDANNIESLFSVDATPPTPSITSIGGDSSAPYATADSSPEVLATTNEASDCRASVDGDETYDQMSDDIDCTGDGGTSHSCQFGTLSNGIITFYVACRDTVGNKNGVSDNAQASATIDATIPIPTITSIGGDGSSPYATTDNTPTVIVSINKNSDCYASTVTDRSYDQMVSGGDTDCSGDGTTTATCDLPTQGEGSHTVYVSCQDYLTNKNSASDNAQSAFTVDTLAPTPAITSIGGDASAPYTTLDNTPLVLATTNENADCRASTDGDETYDQMSDDIGCTPNGGGTSHSCQMGIFSEGATTVYVACMDLLGNRNTAANNAEASVTVDSVAPTPTITSIGGDSSAPYATTDNTPTVLVTTNEASDCRATINGDGSYDDMVGDVDCSGDGGISHTCQFTATISDGVKTFYVACKDTIGNKDTPSTNAQAIATIDTTAPIITTNSARDTTITTTSHTFNISTDEDANCSVFYDSVWHANSTIGTEHTWATTLSETTHTGIYYRCEDALENSRDTSPYWLNVDITPPTTTWGSWAYDTTQSTDPLTINWTTDELANCTLYVGSNTFFDIPPILATDHEENISGLLDGNYTVYTLCDDAYNNSLMSSSKWLNISDYVTFVPPTENDSAWLVNASSTPINVTTNFDAKHCYLGWDLGTSNETNLTMEKVTAYNYYLDAIPAINEVYNYRVYCNSTYNDGSYETEQRSITFSNVPPDTAPPKITDVSPTLGMTIDYIYADTAIWLTVYTNERVSTCRWSGSNETLLENMTDTFLSLNGENPSWKQKTSITLPPGGQRRCWYVRCNDSKGNAMNTSEEICYSVSSYQGGGGGGGGGEIEIVKQIPDNFVLYRQSSDIACKGIPICLNSMTYDATNKLFIPIPIEAYGTKVASPLNGVYTVCNVADHPSNLSINVIGYSTNWGNTSEWLTTDKSNLDLSDGECGTFKVMTIYPELATGVFKDSPNMTFGISVDGVEKSIFIPVKTLAPPTTTLEDLTGTNIFGIPLWLWGIGLFILIFVLIMIGAGRKS